MKDLAIILINYNSEKKLKTHISHIEKMTINKKIYIINTEDKIIEVNSKCSIVNCSKNNLMDSLNNIVNKLTEKYVIIVDCNNEVKYGAIQKAVEENKNSDYIIFPQYIRGEKNIILPWDYKQDIYNNSSILTGSKKEQLFSVFNHGISGIIRVNLLRENKIEFMSNNQLYCDEIYIKKVIHYSKEVKYINEEVFYIDKLSNKILNAHSCDKILGINEMYFELRNILNRKELENLQYIVVRNIIYMLDYSYNKVDENIKLEILNEIDLLFKDIFDSVISKFNLEKRDLIYLLKKDNKIEALSYIELILSRNYYSEIEETKKNMLKKYPDLSKAKLFNMLKPFMSLTEWFNGIKSYIEFICILALSRIIKLSPYGKKIILIGERTDQAEDNAYHLFKYIRTNHKKEKIYYIIEKDCEQLKNIEEYGNIINYGSFKHKLYMIMADVFVSAYHFKSFSYPKNFEQYEKYIKAKEVFLQHGVYIHDVSEWTFVEKNPYDLLITSSPLEKKYVMNMMGYSSEVVKDIGLCRFDNLHNNKVKREILLMPTWRAFLRNENMKSFKFTEYYKRYYNLLTNEKLNKILRENNVILNFYIHSEMQKFLELFDIESENINIFKKSDISVQELLKENALLITDYSSVASDFLYMNKPVIMYQFDPERYQYKPSKYISYSDVGIVLNDEEAVINTINSFIKTDFKIDQKHKKSARRIFKVRDSKNCERTYNEILKLMKKR